MTSVARTCSVEGCGRKHNSKGFCAAHYRRHRNGLPMDLVTRVKNQGMKCSQQACERGAESSGLCGTHYARKRRGVSLEPPIRVRSGLTTCTYPGCEKTYRYFGYCQMHARRKAKGTDMDRPMQRPRKHEGCLISGCDRKHDANGYCGTHGYTIRRFNLTEDQVSRLYSEDATCDICGGVQLNGRALAVDHDHSCCPGKRSCGKCVRGFLCSACNTSIGHMEDDIDRLRSAIEYLEARNVTDVLE